MKNYQNKNKFKLVISNRIKEDFPWKKLFKFN